MLLLLLGRGAELRTGEELRVLRSFFFFVLSLLLLRDAAVEDERGEREESEESEASASVVTGLAER